MNNTGPLNLSTPCNLGSCQQGSGARRAGPGPKKWPIRQTDRHKWTFKAKCMIPGPRLGWPSPVYYKTFSHNPFRQEHISETKNKWENWYRWQPSSQKLSYFISQVTTTLMTGNVFEEEPSQKNRSVFELHFLILSTFYWFSWKNVYPYNLDYFKMKCISGKLFVSAKILPSFFIPEVHRRDTTIAEQSEKSMEVRERWKLKD